MESLAVIVFPDDVPSNITVPPFAINVSLLLQFPLTVIVPDVAIKIAPEEIDTFPLISQTHASPAKLNIPPFIARPPEVILPPFVTKNPEMFVKIPVPILILLPLPSVVIELPEAVLRL